VDGAGAVEHRRKSAASAINELVTYNEFAGLHVWLKTARRGRADHSCYAERFERPDVGPVVDPMRWKLVLLTVSGQERHTDIADRPQGDRVARIAIGRLHCKLMGVIKQGIESGAANDSDICNVLILDRSSLYLGCPQVSTRPHRREGASTPRGIGGETGMPQRLSHISASGRSIRTLAE
jgi:hypothetical protein